MWAIKSYCARLCTINPEFESVRDGTLKTNDCRPSRRSEQWSASEDASSGLCIECDTSGHREDKFSRLVSVIAARYCAIVKVREHGKQIDYVYEVCFVLMGFRVIGV